MKPGQHVKKVGTGRTGVVLRLLTSAERARFTGAEAIVRLDGVTVADWTNHSGLDIPADVVWWPDDVVEILP